MDVTKIPFIEKVGVTRTEAGGLQLLYIESNLNHLQTIHASAQFALAETASGEILQTLFPELLGKVIPVLRDSQIKFRKAAVKSISAYALVTDEVIEIFKDQFKKKKRSSISVTVEIKDSDNVVTCSGEFSWFVQSAE